LPALPASVPEPLRAITVAAMAKNPADRPSSAAELAARLSAVARRRPLRTQARDLRKRPLPALTGAAAVRLAARPAAEYPARWLAVCQRAGELRQRYSISGISLIGAVVILLVVLSVLAASSQGAGPTASDTPDPGAGTVRVGNDAGKGDG
ncbi:MAG TPA: hypothetical protein VFH02_10335, partial [Jiangellaceae bacterium]|nr:hypothetical protein [Jiangellaceae bacterium]